MDSSYDLANLPKGQQMLWRMIRTQEFWIIQQLVPLGFWALFTMVYRINFTPIAAIILGATLIVQIYLHEVGHLNVLRSQKIESKIWWLFPFGAAAGGINPEEDKKTFGLNQGIFTSYALAGIFINTMLVILGTLLRHYEVRFLMMVGNALIITGFCSIIPNLLPVWQVDGAFAFRAIFGSAGKKGSKILTLMISIIAVSAMAITFRFIPKDPGFLGILEKIYFRIGWTVVPTLLVIGVWKKRKESLANPLPGKPMAFWQCLGFTLLILVMFYIPTWAAFGSP